MLSIGKQKKKKDHPFIRKYKVDSSDVNNVIKIGCPQQKKFK